ncbi:MAG: RAQPRD family integrative conjugative element protein [Pseudomonadota bacterium]
MKRLSIICLLFTLLMTNSVSANGNLADLIIELQHLKRMVAQQKQAADRASQRIVFRYDLVEQRIDALIVDIEKHRALMERQPRHQLIDKVHSQ